MFAASGAAMMPGVQIVIQLNRWEPPEGTICLRSEPPADDLLASSFDGWLALVGRLYELLGSPAQPSDADGRRTG